MKLDIASYESMTADEAISRFDWGYDADFSKQIYYALDGSLEVFAGTITPELGDYSTCEIYDGCMLVAQQQGVTIEEAIKSAYTELNESR